MTHFHAGKPPLPRVVHDRKNRPEPEGQEGALPPGVPGIMEAVCGYARSAGKHLCRETGCVPADWQRVRRRVYDVLIDELRAPRTILAKVQP